VERERKGGNPLSNEAVRRKVLSKERGGERLWLGEEGAGFMGKGKITILGRIRCEKPDSHSWRSAVLSKINFPATAPQGLKNSDILYNSSSPKYKK